jgi:U4/U6 small nuclear ribonucleoprotein PRP3
MADKRPHDANGDSANKRARIDDATGAPAKLSIQEQIAAAKARAAAAKERLQGLQPSAGVPATNGAAVISPADAARARIEAMKARVAAATGKSAANGAPPQRPAAPTPPPYRSVPPPPPTMQEPPRLSGGLGIGLHPALMGDLGAGNRSNPGTRFSTTLGNKRPESPALGKDKKQLDLTAPTLEELKTNQYFDASLGAPAIARGRRKRELIFNEKGKFIAQAAALRRQHGLEQMKKRIAEQARKAGLDEDRSEESFKLVPPPEIEWWDEGLLEGEAYPDFEDDAMAAEKKLKITTEDSIVTRYIQHPVLLVPPQEKNIPAPKPMFLTKEEQKKKRRQNRQVVLKEKQAKQRLGLEPPEPPKVKKSNLMRVLGEQAVKDPTAVEQRVNREIAERAEKHEQTNLERKLTKEERAAKLAEQQEKDAARGVYMCVFRIDNLSFGKHRYKVDVNAKQNALTGITILNPKLNLVVVEGGAHSINPYKKLMLQRIDWTEISPPSSTQKEPDAKDEAAKAWWLKPEEDNGKLKDLSENRCVLVWEGQVKERVFKKWSSKVCETDGDARRALERMKMENMWQTAKNWNG